MKDTLTFYDEDWIKINNYHEKIVALDFVRNRIKETLDYSWLIEV